MHRATQISAAYPSFKTPGVGSGFRSTMLALAAAGLAMLSTGAKADLVFRFHNLSNVEAKGVMQNVGIVWLRRGQVEATRAKGDWSRERGCDWYSPCPDVLKSEYTANFEHLSNAGFQYCVWKITRRVNRTDNLNLPGTVDITPTLTHQQAGFTCNVSGQMTAGWSYNSEGQGATLDFSVKSN